MKPVRLAVEYLLLAGFFVARPLLVLQALAFGTAAAAAWTVTSSGLPGWVAQALVSAAVLSATLFVTGLLLPVARRWERRDADQRATAVWPIPFGLTLFLLAGLALYAAAPLPALWSEISSRLNGNIDWGDLSRPAPNAGVILLPILIGLMVPALVSAAALSAIVLPLALLAMLPSRGPRFMPLVGMSAVFQAGITLAGWLASRTLSGLVSAAGTLMRDSGDAEVLQVAEQLTQASGLLESTAVALLAPALGFVAWLVVLHPWRNT
jgi:hypothetical protein